MIVEINGKKSELKRVAGVKPSTDKIDVASIERDTVLVKVPYKFNPEVHYPIIEKIFAEYWKEAWDPEHLIFTPEAGEWEVGVSVASIIGNYVEELAKTYWGDSVRLQYTGVDSDQEKDGLEAIDVYATMSSDCAKRLLRSGVLDKVKFNAKYNAWLEKNPDVDYRGELHSGVHTDVVLGIDPEVWGMALECSRTLADACGENFTEEDIFTKFLENRADRVKNAIYVLSPSDRAEMVELIAAE